MSQLNIFFLGATGYIGGNVLQHLLRHPLFSKFNIITLARSDEKAEKLREFGVAAIVGSLQDLQLLEDQATVSDIVIATANVDDLDAARAILRGLKKRYTEQGKVPLLIHTSGTGLLMRDTQGNSVGFDVPYDDSNLEQLETIPKTAPHRKVDLEVIAADTEGYVRSYIILPSTIYGILKGPLVDAGIVNPYSQQVPLLIRAALDRGMGGMYGLGKNIWNHVHADDLSDLYTLVLDGALKDTVGHGREGLYFGENGEYAYYEVAKAISEALVKLGRSGNPEAISFTEEEKQKYYNGSKFLGTSSRAIATRSRSIGWRPKNTTDDLLASILPEVEAFISRTHA